MSGPLVPRCRELDRPASLAQGQSELRVVGQARGSFEYAGILFEEYRGRVGSVDFTDASKAYFFPVGVPGLFRQYNAPADFVETANTIGLPRYAKQAGTSGSPAG
jgi:Phage major capsid protein E